ncbi:hypothetical protein TD95_003550 [Thielaviopsis punctulata]|uniref:Uncharacterized protein n=1 Tax=Thielaviopsis punctulata TaxID=72032 RepID=A0A0F4ZFZ6_9PEZI|nr:hypothetical protein TD95_003550 [Thielaviopsis punctulata]
MSLEIVTLENYKEKLPAWDPNDPEGQLFAIVDMGSNGIRFTISDLSPPTTRLLKTLYKERAGISLYDALNSSGTMPPTFPPEIITKVASVIARFQAIAKRYGVRKSNFSIMATEAMRKAGNATAMLEAINSSADVGIFVLAPAVETLFGAVMGSRSSFAQVERGGLFLDLGGGSVQMSWVDTRDEGYAEAAAMTGKSLPFGAARLSGILNADDIAMRSAELNSLQAGLRDAFARLCSEFPALQQAHQNKDEGIRVYMCGGGFRGYGSMLMHNDGTSPYPVQSIANYTVDGAYFKATRHMASINESYDGKIFGMSKRRRRQFPAILTVIEAFITAVENIHSVTFCTGSNREGALMMKLPLALRESDPLKALVYMHPRYVPDQPDDEFVATVAAVAQTLKTAVPTEVHFDGKPTVFGLGLERLFASQVWDNMGIEENGNSGLALQRATSMFPGIPGLSHMARAVLGIAMTARWGSKLGPHDRQILESLKTLVKTEDRESVFWNVYIGAVASVLTILVPKCPETPAEIADTVNGRDTDVDYRFSCTWKGSGLVDGVALTISVASTALIGLDKEDIASIIEDVRKESGKKHCGKISVTIKEF